MHDGSQKLPKDPEALDMKAGTAFWGALSRSDLKSDFVEIPYIENF